MKAQEQVFNDSQSLTPVCRGGPSKPKPKRVGFAVPGLDGRPVSPRPSLEVNVSTKAHLQPPIKTPNAVALRLPLCEETEVRDPFYEAPKTDGVMNQVSNQKTSDLKCREDGSHLDEHSEAIKMMYVEGDAEIPFVIMNTNGRDDAGTVMATGMKSKPRLEGFESVEVVGLSYKSFGPVGSFLGGGPNMTKPRLEGVKSDENSGPFFGSTGLVDSI